METVLKDCFWCGQSYSMEVTACPSCAVKTDAMKKVTQPDNGMGK